MYAIIVHDVSAGPGSPGCPLFGADRAAAGADRLALTRDMYALASHLMRSSNFGAFNTIAELELSFTQIKALCAMDMDGEDPSVKASPTRWACRFRP